MISSAKSLTPKMNPNSAVKLVQDLHEDLIQALLQCADLIQPYPLLPLDKRVEMYWDRYFFILLLNHSAVYKRNVSQYITYLAKDFKNTEKFESVLSADVFSNGNEIGQLFRQPYRALSRYYKDRESFGIGTYNVNFYLRILFKINFLQEAAAAPFIRKEWFMIKYEKLAADVRQFKRWVNDKNIVAIINKIDADADRESHESGKQLFTTRYRFIESNTFCPKNPYGEIGSPKMWFQMWRTEHSHPLQMPFAEIYPWYDRLSYLLLGSDVRKYFQDYRRWLIADFETLYHALIECYAAEKGRLNASVTAGVITGIFAANLLIIFGLNLPFALLKGILSLPLRVTHEMTSVSLGGYPEKALVIGLHGLRLLLSVSLLPVIFITFLAVGSISLILNATATVLILPVKRWINSFLKPGEGELRVTKAVNKLKVIVARENKKACFIDGGRLTLQSLNQNSNNSFRSLPNFVVDLKAKILHKETLTLRFYDLIPIKYYWLVGRDALRNDNFHSAPRLVFDWSLHGDPPTEEQLTEIAEHLKERVVALTEFQLIGRFDHSHDFCDILIKNPKLEPHTVNFGRDITFFHLFNLINLLKQKPSIKNIVSLPQDKRLVPEKLREQYYQVKELIKFNKQINVHLRPRVITSIEKEGFQIVAVNNSPSRSLTDNSLFSNAILPLQRVYAVDDMQLPKSGCSKPR